MQPLEWYIRRFRAMSPAEIAWRVRSTFRDGFDRYLVRCRQRPRSLSDVLRSSQADVVPGFRVSDMAVGAWASSASGARECDWYEVLCEKADHIAEHRLSFFDLKNHHLGEPIDWNRDHKSNKSAPIIFAPSIDYRDFEVTGDCKLVWEPNRHHHLVVLARAYRASGQIRYAQAVIEQLASWLEQCPYGLGMNWRSPLELGIRLINWVWAIDLIREAGLIKGEFLAGLLNSVHLHLWEIDRKYSRCSSANNHTIGEAAGVFIASSYFCDLKNAERWRARSRDILCEALFQQTYVDGGGREQALGYHLFVLQFFLLAGMVARVRGEDFPAAYWERLEKMFEFEAALCEGGRDLPMFGDCDDGYVLDLGAGPGGFRPWLAVGAILFGRTDFRACAGDEGEPIRWLPAQHKAARFFGHIPNSPPSSAIASRSFPEAGYYLLQCGGSADADRISVVFDCGKLGLAPLAGHGHADALSFTLRAFGRDVLVDPGTYDYFSYPQWRTYFRSTRAHNTIVVDGKDQSEMLGPFLWGQRAQARCLDWQPTGTGGTVTGEHDGYTRLSDPVVHRRTLELDGENRQITVSDRLITRGRHDVEIYFHLAEHCRLRHIERNRYEIEVPGGLVSLLLDPRLSVRAVTAGETPIAGWVSRGYHRKVASTTFIGCCTFEGETSLICQFTIGKHGV